MALNTESIGDSGVHRDEGLGGSRRLEPLHLALSSAERLTSARLSLRRPCSRCAVSPGSEKASLYERSLSVVTWLGAKPCFLSSLRRSLRAAALALAALDQDLQHLALIVDGPP
jgi:hypothetical protein